MKWVQLKYNLYLRVGEKPPIMKKVLLIDYPYNRVRLTALKCSKVTVVWGVVEEGDSYGTI